MSTGSLVFAVLRALLHLPEAGGVDVQRLDRDEDLVVVEAGGIVVEAPRGLRQGAGRIEDAVGTVAISGHREAAF